VGRELKIDATMVYLAGQLQTFSDGEVPLVVQELQPQLLDVSAQADTARQILSQADQNLLVPGCGKVGRARIHVPCVADNLCNLNGLGHVQREAERA
jgi:hypothetical protein